MVKEGIKTSDPLEEILVQCSAKVICFFCFFFAGMGSPSDLFHASFAGLSGQGHLQCFCNVASVMGFHSVLPAFIYVHRSLQPIM